MEASQRYIPKVIQEDHIKVGETMPLSGMDQSEENKYKTKHQTSSKHKDRQKGNESPYQPMLTRSGRRVKIPLATQGFFESVFGF